MRFRRVLLQLSRVYLALLLLLAAVSIPPWPQATPESALSAWRWIATSTRGQLVDVVIASCLALGIGLLTSSRALHRNEATPPLGRVQQVAFALPFLLLIAVWRVRAGNSAARFDVCAVAGVLHGLTLGRYLCERALAANRLVYLDQSDAPLPGTLSLLWRQQPHALWLTAAQLTLTCIALDALSTRLGFGRVEALTWGDFLGETDTQLLPSGVAGFAIVGSISLPWALFTVGIHHATSRQAR
jgi:hypothetical protein